MFQEFPNAGIHVTAEIGDRRSGGVFNTRGTTPVSIPGSIFVSGFTRLLTGKSSATSEPLPDHPRANNAVAAVITEYRRIRNSFDRFLIR